MALIAPERLDDLRGKRAAYLTIATRVARLALARRDTPNDLRTAFFDAEREYRILLDEIATDMFTDNPKGDNP